MERQNNTTRIVIIIILMPPNECPHILQSRPRLSHPVMCVFVLVYPISAVAMSKGVGNTRRRRGTKSIYHALGEGYKNIMATWITNWGR